MIRFLTILLILLTGLIACSDSDKPAPGEAKSVYRYAMDGAPSSLDPAQAAVIYANFLITNLYDTLYRYKYLARPYELTPNLATAMPDVSDDGLTYTIRIKSGVHFMDDESFPAGQGREVVAEDFVYSIKRHFDPTVRAQGAWLWQGRIVGLDEWKAAGADYSATIEGLKAVDRYTIQISLSKPYPQLVHTLAQGFAALIPREAVEYYGREIAVRPVGSGPFKLVSFTSAKAVLVRNENFRQEPFNLEDEGFDPAVHGFSEVQTLAGQAPPMVDQLEVHFITEDAARWNAFISNELDYIRAPAMQFDAILASRDPVTPLPEIADKYHLLTPLEAGFVHIDFNMDDPAIGYHQDQEQNNRNKALRCAIIKAFDWQARNTAIYYDIAKVYPGIIPPVAPEFDPDLPTDSVTRDLAGAKALLAEHGWTEDTLPTLTYGFQAGVTQRQMYEQIRSFLGDIGYPSEKIRAMTFATFGDFNKAYKQRRVMLIPTGWNMDFPDAENTIQLFYGPNETPGSNNANFRNDEFDRLYEQSAIMRESPQRTELYRRMNQIVIDECVSITGLSRTMVLMWNKRAIAYPDRSFVGGFAARFAAIRQATEADGG